MDIKFGQIYQIVHTNRGRAFSKSKINQYTEECRLAAEKLAEQKREAGFEAEVTNKHLHGSAGVGVIDDQFVVYTNEPGQNYAAGVELAELRQYETAKAADKFYTSGLQSTLHLMEGGAKKYTFSQGPEREIVSLNEIG